MNSRGQNMVIGALVGDAASLGLHWIYDPARIATVAGDAPEFFDPDPAHYKDTTGYFAHAGKRAGDLTHYGAQLMVMVESLAATSGEFDAADYERRFVTNFGPGGAWVGYIDYATRETLRNVDRAESAALDAARGVDLGPYEKDWNVIRSKVMASAQCWRGEALDREIEKAVRITYGNEDDLIARAQEIARRVAAVRGGTHGSDDCQVPAISKLPALIATLHDRSEFDQIVETAVRVTNDNDAAVAWAKPVAFALVEALRGADPAAAVEVGIAATSDTVRAPLETALAHAGDIESMAAHTGRACLLNEAVPLCFFIAMRASTYEAAIRENILAGGDSAGRATIIGALFGAHYEIPEAWIARVPAVAKATKLLGNALTPELQN